MIAKTIKEQYDSNGKYYHPYDVAEKSARALFEAIQMGLGNHNKIRIRHRFIGSTVDGVIIEYSHGKNTVTVLQRSYDAQIIFDGGEVEDYHQAAYWSAL